MYPKVIIARVRHLFLGYARHTRLKQSLNGSDGSVAMPRQCDG